MPIMNTPSNQIIPFLKAGKIKIAVFGLGRIGLPTALAFAEKGITIYGVDTQESVIESLKKLKPHVDEPGLTDLLKTVMKNNKFVVTTNYREAMKESDVFIICVPTPVTADKIPDYSSIIEVCNNGLKFLKKDDLVIVESTISPGTIEHLMVPLIKKSAGLDAGVDYGIACCPERADPGNILVNFKKVPRIIGGYTKKSAEVTTEIYHSITNADIIQVSNDRIACAVKLTENIFRDVNIALINELAILYEKIGLDTIEIIKAASTKWNFQPHFPGAGVGGPCLPANPYYLIQDAIKVGFVPHLIRVAREINDRMPQHIIELTLQALNQAGKSIKTAKIAILGITYKPEVHDFQLSPAIPIIQALEQFGSKIFIYDPLIQSPDTLNHHFLNGVTCANSVEEAISDSDCIIIVTAHRQFSQLKIRDLENLAAKPLTIVDGRNLFDLDQIPSGTIYFGVGRKKVG
ncbi:MAG: nucleotide sugar dehydrogenase [Candidatus Helarchaeota archaeon]|nr:nucleotide sugar dehydrogenase [Candidatus Helarchaeota archaeon]